VQQKLSCDRPREAGGGTPSPSDTLYVAVCRFKLRTRRARRKLLDITDSRRILAGGHAPRPCNSVRWLRGCADSHLGYHWRGGLVRFGDRAWRTSLTRPLHVPQRLGGGVRVARTPLKQFGGNDRALRWRALHQPRTSLVSNDMESG